MIYKAGVALCIILTVYGQIAAKLATRQLGPLPATWEERFAYLLRVAVNPYFISCFLAASLAAVCWIVALSGLELSRAYPFMSLNFVLVLLLSGAVFQEAVTPAKIAGVALIVLGVIVGSIFR
ncbi:MAG TPA: EamA family transporter [Thermoanaerobaculia bacterium]|nr:EamA family transporter [Thermoanaerobaculia bacterium]